jgi:hypothetical protein
MAHATPNKREEGHSSEVVLDDLIVRLSADCPWRDEPRGDGYGPRFVALPPRRPSDLRLHGGSAWCPARRKAFPLCGRFVRPLEECSSIVQPGQHVDRRQSH